MWSKNDGMPKDTPPFSGVNTPCLMASRTASPPTGCRSNPPAPDPPPARRRQAKRRPRGGRVWRWRPSSLPSSRGCAAESHAKPPPTRQRMARVWRGPARACSARWRPARLAGAGSPSGWAASPAICPMHHRGGWPAPAACVLRPVLLVSRSAAWRPACSAPNARAMAMKRSSPLFSMVVLVTRRWMLRLPFSCTASSANFRPNCVFPAPGTPTISAMPPLGSPVTHRRRRRLFSAASSSRRPAKYGGGSRSVPSSRGVAA